MADVAGNQIEHSELEPLPTSEASPMPPPVGLNWGVVAQRFGTDVRKLMQSCFVVLPGEFMPEDGYFLHPDTLAAEATSVGQRARRAGYLIGRLAAQELRAKLQVLPVGDPQNENVVIRTAGGPIIGLFSSRRHAEKCRDAILSGSIGSGMSIEDGPLGSELRVNELRIAGVVATCIAGHAGAVISVGGRALHPGTGSANVG